MKDFSLLCGAAVFLAIALVLLREFGFRAAGAVAAVGALVLLGGVFSEAVGQAAAIGERFSETLEEGGKTACKLFGVAALGSLTADLCRDLGEAAVARTVTILTKAELLFLVLPEVFRVLDLGLSLLGG